MNYLAVDTLLGAQRATGRRSSIQLAVRVAHEVAIRFGHLRSIMARNSAHIGSTRSSESKSGSLRVSVSWLGLYFQQTVIGGFRLAATMAGRASWREIGDVIRELYLADDAPWVIGYSGGKDSTAALQLVWYSISELPSKERNRKTIHVISTDTLVEQPLVAASVARSLRLMSEAAGQQGIPVQPNRLTPKLENAFWVNLIGKGYCAPRPTFRWCTSRLKIEPSNRFITEVVRRHGEAILVLGSRKAESAKRAANLARYEKKRTRQWLSPNASLPSSWVFTPIENWTNDDVWVYLMQNDNPWGCSNKDLLTLYRGATADNDCPLVVDTSTPSCGGSRFGCWVCTVVTADKSMAAMIRNDDEKAWMAPMLDFRNELGQLDEYGRIGDWAERDYRRLSGSITLHQRDGRPVHGPYTKQRREYLLRRILQISEQITASRPKEMADWQLITLAELAAIRRLWVVEKSEFDDALPRIYGEVTGREYPKNERLIPGALGESEWNLLAHLAGDDYVYLDLLSSLLCAEQRAYQLGRRRGILDELEGHIERCYYSGEDDAAEFETRRQSLRALTGEQLELSFWEQPSQVAGPAGDER